MREGKGRIDWKRYCEEILIPRFIPFMHRLRKEFPNTKHVVQEDNASSHISKWNREL